MLQARSCILRLPKLLIDDCSRKNTGYRGFASFMASDADSLAVRRFDRLNVRILLRLQDEISALEERLEEVERICMKRDSPEIHNGTFRQDTIPERAQLVVTITEKVERYSVLIVFQLLGCTWS